MVDVDRPAEADRRGRREPRRVRRQVGAEARHAGHDDARIVEGRLDVLDEECRDQLVQGLADCRWAHSTAQQLTGARDFFAWGVGDLG